MYIEYAQLHGSLVQKSDLLSSEQALATVLQAIDEGMRLWVVTREGDQVSVEFVRHETVRFADRFKGDRESMSLIIKVCWMTIQYGQGRSELMMSLRELLPGVTVQTLSFAAHSWRTVVAITANLLGLNTLADAGPLRGLFTESLATLIVQHDKGAPLEEVMACASASRR